MTVGNFLACFNETESFEGGWSDSPHDPGGATMCGVTQATYTAWLRSKGRPVASVRGISLGDREDIYRELFWNEVRGDDLYVGLDLVMTDTAWGSGSYRAIELLQQALGVAIDGEFGPATLAAVRVRENSPSIIQAVCVGRLKFFQSLATWQYFGHGWLARLNGIRAKAVAMNASVLAEK